MASGKPAPDVYLEAVRRLGVDPARAAAIEDSRNGIRSAHAAGLRVVAIPNAQFRPDEDSLALADVVLDSLADLTPDVRRPLSRKLRLVAAEQDAGVVAAEAHRVRERDVDLNLPRLVRDVVEIAVGIGLLVVRGRRENAVVQREHAHHRLDRPGRPEAVARDRLRRGNRELVGVVAEHLLDRARLGEVAERRRGPVRVDVPDAFRIDVGTAQRSAHHVADPDCLGFGLRHVVRVVRSAVAEHLGIDSRTARASLLELLEDERGRALAHHEPLARRVERS